MGKNDKMRVAIVGVGNPFASDDGIGILVVRRFHESVRDERICVLESERGGMDVLDCLVGFDAALIVDAALSAQRPPGSVEAFTFRSPFTPGTSRSLHTVDLRGLLAFGEATGLPLPQEVTVVTVEAKDIETFREGCTPEIERVVPEVLETIAAEIRRLLPDVTIGTNRHEPAIAGEGRSR